MSHAFTVSDAHRLGLDPGGSAHPGESMSYSPSRAATLSVQIVPRITKAAFQRPWRMSSGVLTALLPNLQRRSNTHTPFSRTRNQM
jgi:hypothetical protein